MLKISTKKMILVYMDYFDSSMVNGNNVFVFGSNLAGRHGAGAARIAMNTWGAQYGNGLGIQGHSYAIPTKDGNIETLPLPVIGWYIDIFAKYVANNPGKTFLVTAVGCGLAGYTHFDIAPLFGKHILSIGKNCIFPIPWQPFLDPLASEPLVFES